jgi:hypothetical protein
MSKPKQKPCARSNVPYPLKQEFYPDGQLPVISFLLFQKRTLNIHKKTDKLMLLVKYSEIIFRIIRNLPTIYSLKKCSEF